MRERYVQVTLTAGVIALLAFWGVNERNKWLLLGEWVLDGGDLFSRTTGTADMISFRDNGVMYASGQDGGGVANRYKFDGKNLVIESFESSLGPGTPTRSEVIVTFDRGQMQWEGTSGVTRWMRPQTSNAPPSQPTLDDFRKLGARSMSIDDVIERIGKPMNVYSGRGREWQDFSMYEFDLKDGFAVVASRDRFVHEYWLYDRKQNPVQK